MDLSVLPSASRKVAMLRISDPEVRADAALAQPSHQAKRVIDAVVAPQPVVLAGAVGSPAKIPVVEVKVVLKEELVDERGDAIAVVSDRLYDLKLGATVDVYLEGHEIRRARHRPQRCERVRCR